MIDDIRQILSDIKEPNLNLGLDVAGVVSGVQATSNGADIQLNFPYPAKSAFDAIAATIRQKLTEKGYHNTRLSLSINIHAHTTQGGVERLSGVKNIIAVASAKGGVGKSTAAANIALALAQEGGNVGILDADIYGPSLPIMLGVKNRPQGGDGGGIKPVIAHGIQLMSVGFLVGDDQPMAWRGPMATRALVQLLRDTQWHNLDYLILDMPPGTGDIQLTVAQQIAVTGAIVVTTPQELAVADARRGLVMFGKVSIPVLGIVENMSVHRCPQCGHDSHIFGTGGAKNMGEKYDVELLGELPLDANIRDAADNGMPTVVADSDSDIAKQYRRIAVRAAVKIAEKSRDHSAAFPKIVISE